MSTTIKRWKGCAICGEPFRFTRADARTCSDDCRQALKRRKGQPPMLPGDERRPPYRAATSLARARRALEKGVPFEDLALGMAERDVVVAGNPRLPDEQRLEAAGRLLDSRFAWAKGAPPVARESWKRRPVARGHLEAMLLAAISSAYEPTRAFGTVGRRGAPRRVAPYVPAEELWGVLLRDFLPRELGRLLREWYEQEPPEMDKRDGMASRFEPPIAFSLDGELVDLGGDVLPGHDVVGTTDDAPDEVIWPRQRGGGFQEYRQSLRAPSYPTSKTPTDERAMWPRANPDLTPFELKELRKDLEDAIRGHALQVNGRWGLPAWDDPDESAKNEEERERAFWETQLAEEVLEPEEAR
jgi:predicted nucleic acid-binding Zn ribbon protein